MAKHKKVTLGTEGNTDKTIIIEPEFSEAEVSKIKEAVANRRVGEYTIAKIEPIPQETQPQPTQQNPQKPAFTSDNSEVYRTLLLERPGVPFITTIQEATAFVDRYEKWNRKVQLTFKQ